MIFCCTVYNVKTFVRFIKCDFCSYVHVMKQIPHKKYICSCPVPFKVAHMISCGLLIWGGGKRELLL